MSPWAWVAWAVVVILLVLFAVAMGIGLRETARTRRNDELRPAMSTWLTAALSIEPGPTVFDLDALRGWIDGGCDGDMPMPEGAAMDVSCTACPRVGTEDDFVPLTDNTVGVTVHYCPECWMRLFERKGGG